MLINIHDFLTMEDRVGNSMSNWVSNGNRVSNSMGNWMGNNSWVSNSNWVSNSMGNWMSKNSRVSHSMGHWVSNNSSLDNSWSILRNSLISDILNNSISVVSIVDSLDSSIGKSNSVAARGCVSISGLSLLEVISTVVIIDSILVSIDWGLSKIRGSIARGSNKGTSRGCCSNSYQGRYKESLHCCVVFYKSSF